MPLGHIKTAGAGGTGGAIEPPYFDRSVNPVSARGTDYAHHITTAPPPGFSYLPSALGAHKNCRKRKSWRKLRFQKQK